MIEYIKGFITVAAIILIFYFVIVQPGAKFKALRYNTTTFPSKSYKNINPPQLLNFYEIDENGNIIGKSNIFPAALGDGVEVTALWSPHGNNSTRRNYYFMAVYDRPAKLKSYKVNTKGKFEKFEILANINKTDRKFKKIATSFIPSGGPNNSISSTENGLHDNKGLIPYLDKIVIAVEVDPTKVNADTGMSIVKLEVE